MRYIQGLSRTFTFKVEEYRFNSGNNTFNAISVWKIDDNADKTIMIQKNSYIVNELQENALYYNTRAMRINYLHMCDLLLPKAKPAALRTIYHIPFQTFDAATENDIMELWNTIYLIDDNISQQDHIAESITKRVCKMVKQEFEQLHCIPDPVPGEGFHYKSFEKLYSIPTTEEHRPSLKNAKLKTTKS
ncbi:1246_t:CDS:2, partial [Gigaspora margarita]